MKRVAYAKKGGGHGTWHPIAVGKGRQELNDLDKRIAEAKGWRLFKPGETTPKDHAEWSESKAIWKPESLADWSTSDTKAFELVDELQDLQFVLSRACNSHTGAPTDVWIARFARDWSEAAGGIQIGQGLGTRPEAICRAYLAAMEYLKGKKA
jgi:hypothetical protein